MKRSFLFAAFAAASAQAAQDPVPLTTIELKERAARPVIVVAPKYPPGALAEKMEATVDLFGTVHPDGVFQVSRMEAAPDRDEFKAAVRDVLEYWRVMPEYGDDCLPRDAQGQVRVWFEIKEGRPAISVSRAPGPRLDESVDRDKPKLRVVKRHEPNYPRDAIRAGVEATVEAYLRVDPDGKVGHVEIAPTPSHRVFVSEVRTAMKDWVFEPRTDGKTLCAYYEVRFRLGN